MPLVQYDWREIDPLILDGVKPSHIATLPPAVAQGLTVPQIRGRSDTLKRPGIRRNTSEDVATIRARYLPATDLGAREREYHERSLAFLDSAKNALNRIATRSLRLAKKLDAAGEADDASIAYRRAAQNIRDLVWTVATERDILGLPAPRAPELDQGVREIIILEGHSASSSN